jgi:hypothetical protein
MPKPHSKTTPSKNKEDAPRKRWHRSFRRSYREDYVRNLEVPGLLYHAVSTLRLLLKNWKIFLPLLILIVVCNIVFVGIMSQDTYNVFNEAIDETQSQIAVGKLNNFARAGLLLIGTVTTGGLNQSLTETQGVFAFLFFLIIWLVTIYLIRHILAKHHPKLRDGLYNALSPLISTLVVFCLLIVQLIPVMLVAISYPIAIQTEFLSTPFYALIYFIFASLMVILSLYLVSNSFLACVAVSAPGLYPLAAIRTASNLIMGRRIRLIIRLIYLVFVLAILWVFIMLPIILLDMWLKSIFDWLANVPVVPFFLLCMTVFSCIYFAAYSYLFYRRMLEYDD